MFRDSNLIFALLAVIPALLYILFFYIHLPKTFNIDPLRATRYIFNGILSTLLVVLIHYIYPKWTKFINFDEPIVIFSFFAFIQVALLEEISKMIFIRFSHSTEYKRTSIFQLFFYSTLVSVGFSISENFLYLINNGPGVLLIRALTATVAHFTFGIMMSYFITLAKIKKNKNYWLLAFIIPTFAHGAYDLNLFMGEAVPWIHHPVYSLIILIVILQISVAICSKMIKHIVQLNDELLKD